jgi:caffeoyl-CoA O-methyltransferase
MFELVNLAPTSNYIIDFSEPLTDLSKTLIKETNDKFPCDSCMLVHPVQSRMLKALVKISKSKNVLEIGCFTGHSGLSMAEAVPEDGSVTTCELSPEFAAVARSYAAKRF